MNKDFYTYFFEQPKEPRSLSNIVWWWESRRVTYNIIIGVIGILSLVFFFLFINLANDSKHEEDAIEPISLLIAPFLINTAYTFGWIVEIFLRVFLNIKSPKTAPLLLKLGLYFSIFIVILPSIFWFFKVITKSIQILVQ